MSIEYDSSKAAWDNYVEIYKNSNVLKWFKYNISELKYQNNRYHSYLNDDEKFKIESPYFKVSGDLIFNFNEKRGHYEYFFKQIKKIDDNKVKNEYINKLEICQCCRKPENTALMITTGGLNNYKNSCKYDRFDVFAYRIKLFFMEEKCEIGWNVQKGTLMFFFRNKYFNLKKEERIYQFLKDWYLINDKKYADRLIESGERRSNISVPDEDDAKCYIDLALEYWEFRKNKYGG